MQTVQLLQFNRKEFEDLLNETVSKAVKNSIVERKSEEDYLSIKQASLFLNLSEQTIYSYTSKGKIPFHKKGKKLFFLKSELKKWLYE